MTAQNRTTEVLLAGPDRTIPSKLIDIAVLAIEHGSTRVSLGHEGLGFDFPAPIGWMLWCDQPAVFTDDDVLIAERGEMRSHQVGSDVDELTVPEWLQTAQTAGARHAVIEILVDLFRVGATNGWNVVYERDVIGEHVMRRHKDGFYLGMRHTLRLTADNYGYDEAARARGDRISTEMTMSLREGDIEDLVAFSQVDGPHRRVDREHVETHARSEAPFLVPVAYFDEERDEWTL